MKTRYLLSLIVLANSAQTSCHNDSLAHHSRAVVAIIIPGSIQGLLKEVVGIGLLGTGLALDYENCKDFYHKQMIHEVGPRIAAGWYLTKEGHSLIKSNASGLTYPIGIVLSVMLACYIHYRQKK